MNREWSDQNRQMQSLLKKETFSEGIGCLIALRDELMREALTWKSLSKEDFCAIPFLNADGYHNKTVAYSLWHIFRIEDIVVNALILQKDTVLARGGYADAMRSPILTTGNELKGEEIAEFSRQLDISVLYQYCQAVKAESDAWLSSLRFSDLKRSFSDADRQRLTALQVVSTDENAFWLIDYWCSKDVKGLIRMPLSRHWIMHIEAALRILRKVNPLF